MSKDVGVEFVPDGIGHLLSDKRFAVPLHQRSYKWEREDHVRRHFDDISESINDPHGYFLGMIMLMRGKGKPKGVRNRESRKVSGTVIIWFLARMAVPPAGLEVTAGGRRGAGRGRAEPGMVANRWRACRAGDAGHPLCDAMEER